MNRQEELILPLDSVAQLIEPCAPSPFLKRRLREDAQKFINTEQERQLLHDLLRASDNIGISWLRLVNPKQFYEPMTWWGWSAMRSNSRRLKKSWQGLENEMLKIVSVMLSIFVLASCSSQQVDRQAISQPTPVGAEPKAPAKVDGNQIVGQTIYVPIYSHIYSRDKGRVINLTATLSIRNTDGQNSIRITSARYYDTNGALVKEYVNQPLGLAPMASTDFVVAEDDTSGGVGANFIVEWGAGVKVTEPVIEAIMISTASQQGISFVSAGRVIKDRVPEHQASKGK